MKPQCIVFDVDDTLFLARDYYRSGIRLVHHWLQDEAGIAGFGPRAWRRFEQNGPGDLFRRTLLEMSVRPKEALLREMTTIFRRHEPEIELLPDARLCLQRLYGDYPLVILTAGPIPEQHAKTEKLGLDRFCTPVLYAGQNSSSSVPCRRSFQEVGQHTGIIAPACLFLADSPGDLLAAREAGLKTARIRREESLYAHLDTPDDFQEFEDLDQFSYWLVTQTSGES